MLPPGSANAPAPAPGGALRAALLALLPAIALLGSAGPPALAQDSLIMQELERREYELGLRMREQRRREELRRDDLREDDRRALERREDLRRDAVREAERRRDIEAEDRRALDRRR